MEFDSANYSITPNTNQDIQEKDLGYNVTIIKGNLYSISFTGIYELMKKKMN